MKLHSAQAIDSYRPWLKSHLSHDRYKHCKRVSKQAGKIAREFGLDEEKARLAGLLHDLAKEMPKVALYKLAVENKITLTFDDIKDLSKLHDRVGAIVAKNELGIEDEEILSAIRCHTNGGHNMSQIAMVTLLADKTERNRDKKQRRVILDALMSGGLRQGLLTALNIKTRAVAEKNKELITPTRNDKGLNQDRQLRLQSA